MKSPSSRSPLLYSLLLLSLLLSSISCSNKSSNAYGSEEASLDAGLEALRVFDFKRSYHIFQQLHASTNVDDTNWALITYSYAVSAWLKTPISPESVSQAESLLETLYEQNPDSIYSANALLDLGRIAEISDFRGDVTDVTTAREYYERVRAEFPNSEMSTRATLFLAQTYAQTLETDGVHRAIDLLEDCIQEQADEEWIGLIAQYLGQLYSDYLNQPNKAIDPLFQATQAGLPRQADTDSVLWRIGVLAQKADRDLLAAQAYTQIIQNFPRTVYRSVSEERLEQIQKKYPEKDIFQKKAQ